MDGCHVAGHFQMVYQMIFALNALIFLNSMNVPTVTNTIPTPKNGACMDILTKHLEFFKKL
jgi:hypothetical protein